MLLRLLRPNATLHHKSAPPHCPTVLLTGDVISQLLAGHELVHAGDPLEQIARVRQESLIVVRVEQLLLAIVRLRGESASKIMKLTHRTPSEATVTGACTLHHANAFVFL